MTTERKNQLFSALFTDEAAAKAALQMTPEEVQAKLADKGLTYSIEEIKELGAELAALAQKAANGEELTAAELQAVAGGAIMGGPGLAISTEAQILSKVISAVGKAVTSFFSKW